MSRVLIVLGVVLFLIVGVALVFYPSDGSRGQANPAIATETPAPSYTSEPTSTTTSAPPTTTPLPRPVETLPVETEPPVEYADASRGGTYGPGDNVRFLGEQGTISSGEIDNGKVLTPYLNMKGEQGERILDYLQSDHPTLGHVEMISYPQRGENGEVYIKVNGKDSGCIMK